MNHDIISTIDTALSGTCSRCGKAAERGPTCEACITTWVAQREELRVRVERQHNDLLALACDVGRKVLTLHARQRNGDCTGCPEGWRVDWPCETYELVAEHYGATFDAEGPHGTEMTVPARQP